MVRPDAVRVKKMASPGGLAIIIGALIKRAPALGLR